MNAANVAVATMTVGAMILTGACFYGGSGSERLLATRLPNLDASSATGAVKPIAVSSKAVAANRPIDRRYSSYGDNLVPDLAWSPVPSSAKSVVFLVEDPDAPPKKPFVHWVIYNIPPDAHSLPGGRATGGAQPRVAKLGRPDTTLDGTNGNGTIGWYGPHPPQGDPPHHYHFEIFALDRMLPVPPGATRDAVETAMAGHVLAKGEFVATYGEK